jgi:uncharacterized protein (DUF2267 family)
MSKSKVFIPIYECTIFEIDNTLSDLRSKEQKLLSKVKQCEDDKNTVDLIRVQKSLIKVMQQVEKLLIEKVRQTLEQAGYV